ncbi:MAG: Ger(x)C family spore germination protein [Tuberibacillus sp.]
MYKHKIFLIMITVLIALLTGCEQPKVIDDIRLIGSLGYDYYNESNVMGTITTPIYAHTGGSGQVQAKTDTFTVVSHRGRALDTLLESRSEHPLQLGKLLVVLYGKRVAKEGIYQFIDILNRNPDVGRTIHLAVVDGTAKKILTKQYKTDQLVSSYLNDLMQHNAQGDFPRTNLHEFLYSYYGEGMDPFLPFLQLKQDHVEIKGIALFKDDSYVSYLPYDYAFPFKMMFQSFNRGSYSVPMDKNHFMSITNINSTVDYRVKFNQQSEPVIYIKVNEKGYLRETSSTINPKQNMRIIQGQMEKTLEKQGKEIISKLQKLNVDALRIGDKVRSYDRN